MHDSAALERGLMVEKGGRDGSVIRFLPPMIISFEQIDFALRVMEEAIIAAGGGLQQDPASREQTNQEWNKHFNDRLGGSDEFASVMNQNHSSDESRFWTGWTLFGFRSAR